MKASRHSRDFRTRSPRLGRRGKAAANGTIERVGSLYRTNSSSPPTIVGAQAPSGKVKDLFLTCVINTATLAPGLPAGTTQVGRFQVGAITMLIGARWMTAANEAHGAVTNASRISAGLYRFSDAPENVLDAFAIYDPAGLEGEGKRVAFINSTTTGVITGNGVTGLTGLTGADYPWSSLPGEFSPEDVIVGFGVLASDQAILAHAALASPLLAPSGAIRTAVGDVEGLTSLAASVRTLASGGGKMSAMLRLVA